jgi:hypothetical protein
MIPAAPAQSCNFILTVGIENKITTYLGHLKIIRGVGIP